MFLKLTLLTLITGGMRIPAPFLRIAKLTKMAS